jgi:hypothetical protein
MRNRLKECLTRVALVYLGTHATFNLQDALNRQVDLLGRHHIIVKGYHSIRIIGLAARRCVIMKREQRKTSRKGVEVILLFQGGWSGHYTRNSKERRSAELELISRLPKLIRQ